jgi:hypothetical protein
MGYYHDQVLPRILNKVMDTKFEREVRGRVCKGLHGQVVEIGFGSGLNAPHYPSQVTNVFAVEPSRVSTQLAGPRIAATAVDVEPAGLDGQRLDLPSEQFDAVLSTWTGCHLTRPIADDIGRAGFGIEQLDMYYAKGAPKPMGYTFEGRALRR